jgi:hypothetical protein
MKALWMALYWILAIAWLVLIASGLLDRGW